MKILLINPSCRAKSGRDLYSAHILGPLFTMQPNKLMTLGIPLALPTIASHTPSEHQVKIIDEEIEDIDFNQEADLVGITAMTFKATRAYEIAQVFRERGIKVVMGGIHASMCPDEASEHVDSVVIGEAEDIWPELLSDMVNGELKHQYEAKSFPDLKGSNIPRYDLVKNDNYLFMYLQTTRGCPYDCLFCTVTKINGHRLRIKSPEQVITEVDYILGLNKQASFNMFDSATREKKRFVGTIAFIDDNFAINRDHALNVCRALQKYQSDHGIIFAWYTQVNYMVGFDDELLSEMEKANCISLFIGFESLDPDTLKSMKKKMNDPTKYAEAINNIHKHGIRVVFSTIIGDDNTSKMSIDYLSKFIEENHVFHVLINILTPYPGTKLLENMQKEFRILETDPQLYNIRNVVFRPDNMSREKLESLYMQACRNIFRFDATFERGKALLPTTSRLRFPYLYRVLIFIGLMYSCIVLGINKKLRWRIAFKIISAAPGLLMSYGSLFAIELLASSADYDDFLQSEIKRFNHDLIATETIMHNHSIPTADHLFNESRHYSVLAPLIDRNMTTLPLSSSDCDGIKEYKASCILNEDLLKYGIKTRESSTNRLILLLGGTSIPVSDRKGLICHILQQGYALATIENSMGGLLDYKINPKKERLDSLRHYIDYLKSTGVREIDIIAQSYSAFEVVRLLLENPTKYRPLVKNIIFINPPGFDRSVGFVRHIMRFIGGHVLGGYVKAFRRNAYNVQSYTEKFTDAEFSKREVQGINNWANKSLTNIARGLRECSDIVSFKLKEPIRQLYRDYGFAINIFVQTDDQLVPAHITVREVADILPPENITIAAGGHNDLFFQSWQRDTLISFLEKNRKHS